uniref:Uncharacterized protein n=1 Tax=Xiphophorus couchianus TaxID=32473 RepID=A0A3B5L6L6_9TELE
MKAVFLCLCLAGTACAVPVSLRFYFKHWNKSRTSKSFLTCMLDVLNYDNNCFYFLLILFQQTFPQYGFIKYSIPQPPGRQSVEVVCADLEQSISNMISTMSPHFSFDVNAQPSQDPLQHKPVQTSQVTKL